MNDIEIEVEDDPVPIVRIIAAQFRRSLHHRQFVSAARGFKGTFALASTTDPQSVTVKAGDGKLFLKHGIDPDAKIVIHLDFNNLDASPRVEGLWRYPLLALKVGKLMENYDTRWTDCAKRFWERASDAARMPKSIRLHCTDDGSELVLGEGEPEMALEGTAKHLCELLSGGNIFVLAVMAGNIRIDGSLEHLTVMSEVTKDMMLGRR